jgi:hypothetical protein
LLGRLSDSPVQRRLTEKTDINAPGAFDFVRLRDDMIDKSFHVLGAIPHGELSIRAGAFRA